MSSERRRCLLVGEEYVAMEDVAMEDVFFAGEENMDMEVVFLLAIKAFIVDLRLASSR